VTAIIAVIASEAKQSHATWDRDCFGVLSHASQ
jgi:hypothetical protein